MGTRHSKHPAWGHLLLQGKESYLTLTIKSTSARVTFRKAAQALMPERRWTSCQITDALDVRVSGNQYSTFRGYSRSETLLCLHCRLA